MRQQNTRAFDKVRAMLTRRDLDFLLRNIAQPPFRRVHDPLKREIIIRAGDNPEIGHRVTDFLPLVETWTPDDTIRQAYGQKPILKSPHLMRRAYQNRHVIKANFAQSACTALHRHDFITNPTGLFFAIPMADQTNLFARRRLRPQRFAQTPLISRDNAGGRREDMRRRPIVLLQLDHMAAGEIRLEPQDVADFGTAPAINRLIIVTHTANVGMSARQQPKP